MSSVLGCNPRGQGDLKQQQFTQGPTVVCQPCSHGRGPFLPLPGCILGCCQPKAVMSPAEVVGTSHEIHPGGQHRLGVGQGASSAHQRCQGAPKGGIESLDISGG